MAKSGLVLIFETSIYVLVSQTWLFVVAFILFNYDQKNEEEKKRTKFAWI